MNMQDTLQLSAWIRGRATLAEVEAAQSVGLVGNVRFTEQARRAYRMLWTWSAPRFSGRAGERQARYYQRRGMDALNRRMERARRIAASL